MFSILLRHHFVDPDTEEPWVEEQLVQVYSAEEFKASLQRYASTGVRYKKLPRRREPDQ